jgi:exodeoxyribonuclease VII small subunit
MRDDQDDPFIGESELAGDDSDERLGENQGHRRRSRPPGGQSRRFESALNEIEVIVSNLEQGDFDLDESLAQYQKGIETLKECHQLLSAAERRITLLSGFDSEGNPVTNCFDESDMTLDEKQSKRGNRRTVQQKAKRPAVEGEEDSGREIDSGLF